MRYTRCVRAISVFVLLSSLLAAADEPLGVADLLRYLRAGISERVILSEVRERGVAGALDAGSLEALRDAGASSAVLEAVSRAAPPPPRAGPAPEDATAPPPSETASGRAALTFPATTQSVRLPVSVVDKKGKPVLGLTAQDFSIAENGKRQAPSFFSAERKPLRLAVALDVSGSMENKFEEVVDALEHFFDLLEPQDEVLVLAFSDGVRVIQDFTADRRRASRNAASIRPGGGTALFDAVIEAIRSVAPGGAESKAVVLVTDGNDTASTATLRDAREAARRAEVPVYSIGIGHEDGGGLLGGLVRRSAGGHGGHGAGRSGSDFDPRPLLDLAEETGGHAEILKDARHHHSGGVDAIRDAAASIALALRERYLLAYEPSAGGRSGWRSIEVKVNRPSVKVRARKGYYADPPSR